MPEIEYAPIAQAKGVLPISSQYGQGPTNVNAMHTFMAPDCIATSPLREYPSEGDHEAPPPFDQPHFKSLTGLMITTLFVLLVTSMFACWARPDFTFPFLLLAYYILCIEGQWSETKIRSVNDKAVADLYGSRASSLVVASTKTLVAVKAFTFLLACVTFVDGFWIFAAFNAWTCKFEDLPKDENINQSTFCFDTVNQRPLIQTLGLHELVLKLSVLNFFLKCWFIALSSIWLVRQRTV